MSAAGVSSQTAFPPISEADHNIPKFGEEALCSNLERVASRNTLLFRLPVDGRDYSFAVDGPRDEESRQYTDKPPLPRPASTASLESVPETLDLSSTEACRRALWVFLSCYSSLRGVFNRDAVERLCQAKQNSTTGITDFRNRQRFRMRALVVNAVHDEFVPVFAAAAADRVGLDSIFDSCIYEWRSGGHSSSLVQKGEEQFNMVVRLLGEQTELRWRGAR